MKQFNTTGVCIPEKHYMVDLTERVRQIKVLVDDGKYFCINRGRQYGKTTTLYALRNALRPEYQVISLDFQRIGNAGFRTEEIFVQSFCRLIKREKRNGLTFPDGVWNNIEKITDISESRVDLQGLFDQVEEWCDSSAQKIVLIIDEVDSATNNQVFLDFLAQLRYAYIDRDTNGTPAFHSVILSGVTDIKHLKSKIRDEDQSKVNSPWNIAADFDIDMSLSAEGIFGMLSGYAADHGFDFDTHAVAKEIFAYTSGYPFLVSRICQLIDTNRIETQFENIRDAWSVRGVRDAVRCIESESNTLFESLTGKVTNNPEIKRLIREMLLEGSDMAYNPDQDTIVLMEMYGLIRRKNKSVVIANRIFETRLYNLFISEEEIGRSAFSDESGLIKNSFIENGKLDMVKILERFIHTYHEILGPLDEKFKEKDGRELFLLYLKPIINGTGNYYIEAQTRNRTRTDVIVDYFGLQYIIELKIWHGDQYNERGEEQIRDYLDYFGLDTGYMLSFNFNKKKETGVREVHIGNKTLFEGVV